MKTQQQTPSVMLLKCEKQLYEAESADWHLLHNRKRNLNSLFGRTDGKQQTYNLQL